jgi:DNA invertase Pin-like site-specific DNA recombinase
VIGGIRVSKTEQDKELQFDALKKAGCEKIFHENVRVPQMTPENGKRN